MKTVLIVDDEPITRMDLSDMLRELGFGVAGEAADGFDAMELCRLKRPDVVLMDVKMPIFDGLSASETILAEELAGCVVLLTAFSDPEIIRRAGAAGVTGYLVKRLTRNRFFPPLRWRWPRACGCGRAGVRPGRRSAAFRRTGRFTRRSRCCPGLSAVQRARPTGKCAKPPWINGFPWRSWRSGSSPRWTGRTMWSL